MESFAAAFRPASLVPGLTGLALAALILAWRFRRPAPAPAPPEPIARADLFLALGIALAFALAAATRLADPAEAVFDECYHARTAMQIVLGQEGMEWTHPPLAKLCMAAALRLSGAVFDPREGVFDPAGPFDPRAVVAWRAPGVLFATLALLLQYALARAVSGRRAAAAAATALLALDGVFFVQARTAMLNAYTVCFVLAAALAAWQICRTDRARWRVALGLALGAAAATRWSALAAFLLLGAFVAGHDLLRVLRAARPWRDAARRAALLALSLVVLPALVYAASFVPELRQAAPDDPWVWFRDRQVSMWEYHTRLSEGHPYASPWWSWPLLVRPVWYFYERMPTGALRGIFCVGNGPLWWALPPALVAAGICALRERRGGLGLVALAGLGLWLVWGVQPRNLVFTHYLLESVPFAAIALGTLGERMWREDGDSLSRRLAIGFALLALLWALFYYPLLSALPLSPGAFSLRVWLGDGWV